MDKTHCYSVDRTSLDYQEFVSKFIVYAFENAKKEGVGYVYCPCKKCRNTKIYEDSLGLKDDLFVYGFDPSYKTWFWHGEGGDEDIDDKMDDGDNERLNEMVEEVVKTYCGNGERISSLHVHNETPLYPGCPEGLTVLKATLQLMNEKAKFSYSDVAFSSLLKLLKSMLPFGNKLPDRAYSAKKVLCPMGMEYEKIHACRNDCILYRKEHATKMRCPKCNTSRYKDEEFEDDDGDDIVGGYKKYAPAKAIWYLPIIPRLKRLFANAEDAKNLTWHADRVKDDDDIISHPADGDQWKKFDIDFPNFGRKATNVRLGLCTDGMNPFGNMSSNYSSWPVMVIIYNLPPWLCMKRKYVMLSLMISGPKQPGNDIDVFLAPLIDDLKILWSKDGVTMFDAYRKLDFPLRGMLFCTVNDLPALGNLSGYSIKGHHACPVCMENTDYTQLKHGGKTVYLGHRRWLSKRHPWRNWKTPFNGRTEHRSPPEHVDGHTILNRLSGIKNDFGKAHKHSKIDGSWKKKSIFFELPYWPTLEVRHCLDVMHIEKNVCESLVGTMLNISGKTKDGVKARRDLAHMGIRPNLLPEINEEKTKLPTACYSLWKEEKKSFIDCVEGIKVPTGYSSKVSSLVSKNEFRLGSMKSHDCHCFIQEILPVAIRSVLPLHVRKCIIRLCRFFKSICSKSISRNVLHKLQEEIVVVLCEMEMYFPPSFFDVMVHVLVHIVREIQLCGPVYLRWMYPFERYMKIFKSSAKNPYRPDASVVERYVTEEAIEYCMDFLAGATVGMPVSRHLDRVDGKGLRKGISVALSAEEHAKAHLTVLRNSVVVQPFVEMHIRLIKQAHCNWGDSEVHAEHIRTFALWLRDTVIGEGHSNTVYWLAFMPSTSVLSYTGYDMNGYTFCTSSWDEKTTTQNCGVVVDGESVERQNSKKQKFVFEKGFFYGTIEEIWELDYTGLKVPLFKCKWVSNDGVLVDELGFTTVDLRKTAFKTDPFILASQADQVFYITDPIVKGRCVVRNGKGQFIEDGNVARSSLFTSDKISLDGISHCPTFTEKDMAQLIVRCENDTGILKKKDLKQHKRKRSVKAKLS